MSIWDTFTGRSSNKSQRQARQPDPVAQDTYQHTPFDASSVQDVSSFLGSDSQPAFDPAALHPLAGLNQETLDYLSLEETQLSDVPGSQTALPSRGFTDDLCYGTGVTYVVGLGTGGAWGLAEGLRRTPASAPPKLRLSMTTIYGSKIDANFKTSDAVLNSITRRGPFLGNNAATIALTYNCINSTIDYYRGKHDATNSLAAGGISGMIFKSTKGLRPMLTSGVMVASAAGVWTIARKALM